MIILLCYWNLTLTLIWQGHLFRMQYQMWMIISWFGEIVPVYMATNGQVTVKAEFKKKPWPCHLKVKMTRNVQNNTRNEFNALKSVEIEVSHLLTKKYDFQNGRWRPFLIWLLRNSWPGGNQAPRWFFMSRDPLTYFKWETSPTPFCKRVYRPGTVLTCFPLQRSASEIPENPL